MLKRPLPMTDGHGMERFISLVLFVAAICVAATVATEGLDRAFGGLFAGEPPTVADEGVQSDTSGESARLPSRRPITERVRIQVQGDVDDYSARVGAE